MCPKQQVIQPHWPAWYFPSAPFGSAVRYITTLCPWITFAKIRVGNGKGKGCSAELGIQSKKPFIQYNFTCWASEGKEVPSQLELQTDQNIPLGLEIETKIRAVLNELSSIELRSADLSLGSSVRKCK